ncbi:MAG: cellulase family glycosylhydrolase [Chitinispirillaceae bacterium]|nr:cellulase family glycosylhydrolase [Chitinispirillaceae bacterium]
MDLYKRLFSCRFFILPCTISTTLAMVQCENIAAPDSESASAYFGKVQVNGNVFTDTSGNTLILKGLGLGDPYMVMQHNRWNEEYFRSAASWGARILRIPIHPWTYRLLGDTSVFSIIDDAVVWAKKYKLYLIIDWHGDGNPVQGIYLSDYHSTTLNETTGFWAKAAERYKNETCIPFYDIFNEVDAIAWEEGSITWAQWKVMADEIIDTIYAHNTKAIPLVGGLEFSYDLQDAMDDPLKNTGYAFSVHPYPGRAGPPYEQNWDRDFGFCAATHPMMLTEFGFDPDDTICPSIYVADTVYGNAILSYADTYGMSWTAFVFFLDPYWPMPLFSDWDSLTPTVSGTLFRNALLKGKGKTGY